MAQKLHTTPLSTAYARSLLELATEKGQAKEIGQELDEIAQIIDSDALFANFLGNPAISETERGQLIRCPLPRCNHAFKISSVVR